MCSFPKELGESYLVYHARLQIIIKSIVSGQRKLYKPIILAIRKWRCKNELGLTLVVIPHSQNKTRG